MTLRTFRESTSPCSWRHSGGLPVTVGDCKSIDGRFSKESSVKRVRRKLKANTELCIGLSIRLSGLTWQGELSPNGIHNADLHYSHVDLRGSNGGLSPVLDHLVGVALVRQTTVKTQDPGFRSSIPSSLGNLFGARKKSTVMSIAAIKRFWEIQKSGKDRDDSNVLTEEEKLALKDSKSLYADERYRVAVPWKNEKPALTDWWYCLVSTERNLKKDSRANEEYGATN